MKLLYKTSLQFLVLAITVLSFTGCMLYYWMQKQISAEIYEQLNFEINLIKSELKAGRTVSFPFVHIDTLDRGSKKIQTFGDTLIFDHVQQVVEEYYFLKKVEDINGVPINISVMTAYIGWKQYAHMIFTACLGIAFLLCVFGLLINYYSNKRIWSPFFSNLDLLRNFSVKSNAPVPWYSSGITEFAALHRTLSEMTEKSRREYVTLREFTENASHEIQTPLSIMRSALERVSQYEMEEGMAISLVDVKSAIDRLSRVNRKLLMLAKLDNNFYIDTQPINFSALLNEKIILMEDLFEQKNINISLTVQESIVIPCDKYLADTLMFNMLSNMLLHTPTKGIASIILTHEYLVFSNDGPVLPFPVERIFERFKKGSSDAKSNGLGLSIVQQICEVNHWDINYAYISDQHRFEITFKS